MQPTSLEPITDQPNLPVGHRLLPPVARAHGLRVGEAGGGVGVVQRATHHDGAG